MTVLVKIETKYGRQLIYPVNDAAKTFAALVGQKTLAKPHLDLIKSLGFEISIEAPQLPEL